MKYFIKETGEEIHLGEFVDFKRTIGDGEGFIQCRFKATQELIDEFRKLDLIEEREDDLPETEEKHDLSVADIINALMLSNEKLEKRLDSIQRDIKFLLSTLKVRKGNGQKNPECSSN